MKPTNEWPAEVHIKTETGVTIHAPEYPTDCDYIRLCNKSGREFAYWHSDEWAEEPALVMGAIIGAICGGDENEAD